MKTHFNKFPLLLIMITICTQGTTCKISHYGIEIHNLTGRQISIDSIVSDERSFKYKIVTLINSLDTMNVLLLETDSLFNSKITHFILYYKHSSSCEHCHFEKKFKPKISTTSTQKIKLYE